LSRRLRIYLAATFALSWGAWGGLAPLAQAGRLTAGLFGNAVAALGMAIPAAYGTLRLLAPGLSLALGAVLLLADSAGLRRSAAAGSPSTRSTR
jgi:hypothetical protein